MRASRRHLRCDLPLLAVVFLLSVAVGIACQVPVFRFALERWEADAYTVAIIPASENGELTAAEQEVVTFLQTASDDHSIFANLEVRTEGVGANETAEARMELYYPQKIRGLKVRPVWTGPVTMENAQLIVDSPVRREIVKRLLAGESATWLLVRSGDSDKDTAAALALNDFASAAKETLRIPEGVVGRDEAESGNFGGDPDNVLRSDVPLQIEFSLIEIDRSDPAEAVFLQMLLNVEDDLGELATEPMAFPVFGRGRVLEPLVGNGVTSENALDYAGYVCGACSCEMKDQNPGLDLLVAADWEAALEGNEVIIDKVLPPLEGVASVIGAESAETPRSDQLTTSQDGAKTNNGDGSFSLASIIGITLAIVVIAVVLGSFFVFRPSR